MDSQSELIAETGAWPSYSSASVRFGPPRPQRAWVDRRRLLDIVHLRWERRVVVLLAGPGFGKTTLLGQAFAANREADWGLDIWVTCRPEDSFGHSLVAALADRLSCPVAGDDPAATISSAIWRRAPRHVAVLLDDAHHLEPGSTGARFVERLMAEMPDNGHLVLSGRPPLAVPMARSLAVGEAVRVDAEALRFTDDELRTFAHLRGADLDRVNDVGGWPALAELRTSTDDRVVGDFIWEEVLRGVPEDARQGLACIALVGAVDPALAVVAAGRPVDLDDLVGGLPLVTRDGQWTELHPLWREHLGPMLGPEERRLVQSRTAEVLNGRGDHDRAFNLLVEAGADDQIRARCLDACLSPHGAVSRRSLGRWLRQLPDHLRPSAEGRLLEGVVLLSERYSAPVTAFEDALAAFRSQGNPRGELACIAHLAVRATEGSDIEQMQQLSARAAELEQSGVAEAGPLASLSRAVTAMVRDDHRGALRELEIGVHQALDDAVAGLLEFYRFQEYFTVGECEAALACARTAADRASPSLRASALDGVRLSLWHLGRIDEALEAGAAALATTESSQPRNAVTTLAHSAMVVGSLGQTDEARRYLADAWQHNPRSQGPYAAQLLDGIALMFAVMAGDEEGAAGALRAALENSPPTTPAHSIGYQVIAPYLYILLPEARELLGFMDLPPLYAIGLTLAEAIVAVRQSGSFETVRTLSWPEPGMVRSKLPVPWAVELAVAGVAAGRPEAKALLDSIGETAAPWLGRLAAGSSPVAQTACRLVATLPAPPDSRVEIGVLGPISLRRNGQAVDHPGLHRGRVRAILGYLVVHRTCSRERIARMLWPDLEPAAAANNLRVNLKHLIDVLEPHKGANAPPYLLRTSGDVLRLEGARRWLTVDHWEFERHADRAGEAEQVGATAEVLDHLLAATAAYRGPFLEDLDQDWATYERERLRSRFVTVAVRAVDLLASHREPGEAVRLAVRAVEADGWSEDAHRSLAAAYLACGDRASARRTLLRCRDVLAELGAEAQADTVALERRVARAG